MSGKCSLHVGLAVIGMGLAIMSGCSGEQEQSLKIRHDILACDVLGELRWLVQEETQVIDFRKSASPQEHLLYGWSSPGEDGTWADATHSAIQFYRYNVEKDLDIEVSCYAILSKSRAPQVVEIVLNGTPVTSFTVQTAELDAYRVTLPASGLQGGGNSLEFRFSYTTRPAELGRSRDTRNLSVAFGSITFEDNDCVKLDDAGHLIQRGGSRVDWLGELPSQFEVEIEYDSQPGGKLWVEIVDENQERVRLKLSSRRDVFRKVVKLGDEGLYALRLVRSGSRDTYTVWKKIQINVPASETEEVPQESEGVLAGVKPDIFLYVVDALRADHLGCYGYERDTSPNTDRFAEENTLFVNAYAPASWTRASGASIFTGLLAKHHRTMTRNDALPDSLVTLAEFLQEQGYYTIAFVGNGNLNAKLGFGQGFDKYRGFFRQDYPVTMLVPADELVDHASRFLARYTRKASRAPLFMLVWTMDPHDPYAPKESVKDMFGIDQYQAVDTYPLEFLRNVRSGKRRLTKSEANYVETRYDQEIYFNDISFGDLLDAFKRLGVYDDAMIIFTSDHGEEFFEHGGVGHGLTLYNEQVKIPLIVKAPQLAPGREMKRVQLTDIYPTVADVLAGEPPYTLDGRSLFADDTGVRTLFFEEELDGNTLTAVLGSQKKVIYNRWSERPPSHPLVPMFEVFEVGDTYEQENMQLPGMGTRYLWQQLSVFMHSPGGLHVQRNRIELPPDVEQQLRGLGYIQ